MLVLGARQFRQLAKRRPDTQHDDYRHREQPALDFGVIMLIFLYTESHYSDCHYATKISLDYLTLASHHL